MKFYSYTRIDGVGLIECILSAFPRRFGTFQNIVTKSLISVYLWGRTDSGQNSVQLSVLSSTCFMRRYNCELQLTSEIEVYMCCTLFKFT